MIRCNIIDGCHNWSNVWVCDSEKILWYEIPKNASSAMKSAISGKFKNIKYSEKYDNYYKFCITRNPWDRMVSNWRMYCYSQIKGDIIKKIFNTTVKELSFKKFIELSIIHRNHHWESQFEFIETKNNELLLDDFFDINKFNGDKFGLTVPKINTTKRNTYQEYYTDDTIEIIYNEYKKDIDLFNYEF